MTERGDEHVEAGEATRAADEATEAADSAQSQPRRQAPPFTHRRLRRQLALDAGLRLLVTLGVVAMLVAVSWQAGGSWVAVTLAVVLALGAWMLINGISARTSSQLSRLTVMVERDRAGAEDRLAWHLKRMPLLRWVRLLLYHRLALLRHHQQRYDEAAAICQALLGYRLGPAEGTRPSILLLLAEAQIERGDASGAYPAVAALYAMSLPLIESMQRLALQTRYELLAGYPNHALWQHQRKVRLAELMPAGHDGAVHAMLATAADRCQQPALADWFWRRVRLLATDQQRRQFEQGRFTLPITSAAEDLDTEQSAAPL
jgi:hypothetical protein